MKMPWSATVASCPPEPRQRAFGSFFRLFDGSLNWHPASTAPFNRNVQVRVAGENKSSVVPFPCRQTTGGWINADLGVRIDMQPAEWRAWPEGRA